MFAHIHLHNEYSQLDGYGTAKQFITRAKELEMKYLALTNHGNIAGCLKWQKECDKQGIQPILGAELYIVSDAKVKNKEKAAHILILVTNHTGWTELSRILTYANLVGFHSRPRIDFETLLNSDLSGWIITTACINSWIKLKGAEKVFDELKDRMEGRLYLEIMPHSEQIQTDHHKNFIIPLREETGLPFVATNDCHYVLRGDWKAQECLLAIQKNAKWNDPNRWKFDIKGLHLRSETEMRKAFERQGQFKEGEIQEALENTVKIAEQCCNFRIPKQEISLPSPPFIEDKDENKLMDELCWQAIDAKGLDDDYKNRYRQEFKLIKKKNFARYFLIVYDVIQYCNKAGIMYGPGRGSVGCSMTAFLMGITKIDPLKFDLPFSRFLSEDRIDYPDIDIDVEDTKREQVVDYIHKAYGQDNVCGISTDSRMKSRGVIWDVGRVFEIPSSEVKNIAQNIQSEDNGNNAVAICIEEDLIGKKFKEDFPDAARLAAKLEGQLRHFGQHPAAVVICADDLTTGKYGPLRVQKGNVVSAWDMEDSEYNGLMKLDILGLTTLSILSECLRLINSRNGEETSTGFFYYPESESFFVDKNRTDEPFPIERLEIGITLDKIPLGDEEVFKQLSEGKTSGVFQFSARPTTQLCKEVGIESFNDMVAIVALVRPGPTQSGMTENFTLRKHGQKWKPLNSIYEEITKDTYGLIVYQEQVMQVISKVAGLSESTADEIRKVIGKKRDVKEFEPYRIRFLNGCKKQKTLSEREANEFWEGLKEHAHYCVTGDTLVYRGSCNDKAGREIKVKDLYLLQKSWNFRNYGYKILSMHNDEFVRPNKVKAIYDTGIQNVSFIRTNSGRSIRATEKHLFLTSNGWIKLKNIHVGDLLKISDLKSPSYHGSGIGKGSHGALDLSSPRKREGEGVENEVRKQKEKYLLVYKGCQNCGSTYRLELHHIDEDRSNNSDENTELLCRKCHKKRKHSKKEGGAIRKGYYTVYEKVEEIIPVGKRQTYDIEMEEKPRNFVANGFIVHNSFNKAHSVEYAMIGYWTCWLRIYYPEEFFCACLSYSKAEKQELIDEVLRQEFRVVLPKVGISDANRWTLSEDGKTFYAPFTEVNSIGPEQARKVCAPEEDQNVGFFNIKPTVNSKTELGKLLNEIGANDPEAMPDSEIIQKHFQFILSPPEKTYPKLIKLTHTLDLGLESYYPGLLYPVKRFQNKEIKNCSRCELRQECKAPVLPSPGIFNAFIVGEAPGNLEDEYGRGFYEEAPAGELLWKELGLYGLERRMFFVNNIVRCYPSSTRTPKPEHIETCLPWFREEVKIIQPKLILAIGNTCVKVFKNQDGGIQKLSGTTEWNEEYGAWICYTLHPAAVARRPSNSEYFEKGIRNFARKFKLLTGK